MYIYAKNNVFIAKEYLSPIGKVVKGKLAKSSFFEKYDAYTEKRKNILTELDINQAKSSDNISEDEKKSRKDKVQELIKDLNALKQPVLNKSRIQSVRMRVIGYSIEGHSILYPADKRAINILKKMGYNTFNVISYT